MVFQHYALYPHLNVYDNMALGLKLANFPKQRSVTGGGAAQMLHIAPLLERMLHQCSGVSASGSLLGGRRPPTQGLFV